MEERYGIADEAVSEWIKKLSAARGLRRAQMVSLLLRSLDPSCPRKRG